MKKEYILENYKFKKLSNNDDLDNFYSISQDLNDFLKNDALKQQECMLNLTHLVKCDEEIIGFFSLLTDTLKLKNLRDKNVKFKIKEQIPIKNIPAIKLGRFAIDKKYTNKGIGTDVFGNILYNIKLISQNYIGFRFVTIDAYARAYHFYNNYGAFNFKKDDKKIEKIEKIIKRDPESKLNLYIDLEKTKIFNKNY